MPILDDDSQRILDESYEAYSGTYGRGVNPGRLTPQDCMQHCKKVYYKIDLCNLIYFSLFQIVYTNTIAGNSYSCINEVM